MARAPGSDGYYSHGGFIIDVGERKAALRGDNLWTTYDNLLVNVTTVGAAVGIWLDLQGSARWTVKPNPRGGKDAVLAAELVQHGLIGAPMPTRWRAVVRKQGMKKFRGFATHAMGWRRAADGRIVLAELAHRAQWSIERWIKPNEGEPWTGVVQRSRSGKEFPIAREDLFYSAEGAIGDDPRGVGLFRLLVEIAEIYARYRQLQGTAFDTDTNGIPVGYAPLSDLRDEARQTEAYKNATTDDEQAVVEAAYIDRNIRSLRNLIEKRVVTPNRSAVFDGTPYFSTETDGTQRPSSVMRWRLEILRQNIGSIPELGKALTECNFAMACVMSAEWMLMGQAGSSGAYNATADKSSVFCRRIDASNDDISDDAERDIIPSLLARNGMTDERLMPDLQHESVARSSAKQAAEMLKHLAAARLRPGDKAENVLRAWEELPDAPAPTEAELAADRARREGVVPEVRSDEGGDEDEDDSEDDTAGEGATKETP